MLLFLESRTETHDLLECINELVVYEVDDASVVVGAEKEGGGGRI